MYKHTKINTLISIVISCFISSLAFSAIVSDEVLNQEKAKIFQEEKDEVIFLKKTCNQLKSNPSSSLSIYFNNIMNHILNKNTDILDLNKLDIKDFCILVDPNVDFIDNMGYGLIEVNPYILLLNSISSDAVVASLISHELAHNILKHYQKEADTRIGVLVKLEHLKQKEMDWDALKQIGQENENLAKQIREHEIEADILGFKLYLKAGFKPEIYRDSLLYRKSSKDPPEINITDEITVPEKKAGSIFENLSDETFNLFKVTSTPSGCIAEGSKIIKEKGDFKKFMDTIQYYPTSDADHPTDCWRYWNIQIQLCSQTNKTYRTQNTLVNLQDSPLIKLKFAIHRSLYEY